MVEYPLSFTLCAAMDCELDDDILECNEHDLFHIQIHDTGGFTVVELIPTRYTSEEGYEYDFKYHDKYEGWYEAKAGLVKLIEEQQVDKQN